MLSVRCKRLNGLVRSSSLLSKASPKALVVRAKNWCDAASRFLKLCVEAGNVEAYYTLRMIRFYCLENRGSRDSLFAKAAINPHAPAWYNLTVIQFNGRRPSKNKKYFKEIGVHADVKYIDPTYMICACRANASDGILCTVLGQNVVHGAFAGFSGITVGICNTH